MDVSENYRLIPTTRDKVDLAGHPRSSRLIPLFPDNGWSNASQQTHGRLDGSWNAFGPVHVTIAQVAEPPSDRTTQARYSRCTLPRNVPIACPSVELIDVCSGTLPRTTARTICSLDTLWPTLKSTLSWQLGRLVVFLMYVLSEPVSFP